MFNGIAITIDGKPLEGSYISPNTWTVKREKLLIRSWRDMTGTRHDDYYPNRKATINFTLRQHTAEEHAFLISLFSKVDNVPVEYWDDSTGDYVTGFFKITEPEWKHIVTRGNVILYDSTAVTMGEM